MIPFLIMIAVIILIGGAVAGIVALLSLAGLRETLTALEGRIVDMEGRIRGMESARQEPGLDLLEVDSSDQPMGPVLEEALMVTQPVPSKPEQGMESDVVPTKLHDLQWWNSLEETVGKRWMTWAGALALFFSVGFFLKYAFENNWIGPTGRVVLGIGAGSALAVLGDHLLRRGMKALGQGLTGGALAMLYVSLFAAFSLYHLIPQIPAFASIVVVTTFGFALAVLHEAVPLAFLAVLGGLVSPLMVATGEDPRDALFAYLTVLNLGVLGVAFYKRWRALELLAFVGTWALFTGWYHYFYRSAAMVPTLVWIGAFFLMFLVIPFVYQLRLRSTSTVESFVMALANAAIAFAYCYLALHNEYRHVLGFVAVAMATCYLLMAYLSRQRVPADARSLFGFVALSVVFLTLAVPLHLKVHGITLAWAVEGPILLYLGYVYKYRPVRIAAFVVLALAAARLFLAHWPLHRELYVLFLNRYFIAALMVPIAAAVFAFIHRSKESEATSIDRVLMGAAWLSAAFLALVILCGEVGPWVRNQAADERISAHYLSICSYELIWALGAAGFLAAGLGAKSKIAFHAGLAALIVSVGFGIASYLARTPAEYMLFVNLRFGVGLLVAGCLFGYAFVAAGRGDLFSRETPAVAKSLFWSAVFLPLALLSVEAYTYSYRAAYSLRTARWMAQMSISIVWGLYAVAMLAVGFSRQVRKLRLAALALLAVTAAKLAIVDMAHVQQIYRIISFVVLGLTMIVASYLYHKLETRRDKDKGEST